MYNKLAILLSFFAVSLLYAQKEKEIDSLQTLKEASAASCTCVNSISTYNKDRAEISKEIHSCLNEYALAYQLGTKMIAELSDIKKSGKEKEKDVEIAINSDENSAEYKSSYYELERYMMRNCPSLRDKITTTEKQNENSVSDQKKAVKWYTKGQKAYDKNDFKGAIEFYKEALKEDPKFAFAWDNLGRTYREIKEYDKAIDAYNKSLEIDPNGLFPLQNMAIVYIFKEEYEKAIQTYERLALLDDKNPEVHFGIGNIYTSHLKQYEKGLDHLCKAYKLYVAQKSPYRTDAEGLISIVYSEMKKAGKLQEFNEILKKNDISQTD